MTRILDRDGHPGLGEVLRELRSVELQRDRHRFRENVRLLGTLVGHEIAGTLPHRMESVETPLGSARVARFEDWPVLATALRAGLPFIEGLQAIFRHSDSMYFGAARVEGSAPSSQLEMPIRLSYRALAACRERTVIFADPMVATGSTIVDIHRHLVESGQAPSRFIIAGLVGFTGAVERLEVEIPGVEIWLCTCDSVLDARGYIVPGLGDAGDLCFGEKI